MMNKCLPLRGQRQLQEHRPAAAQPEEEYCCRWELDLRIRQPESQCCLAATLTVAALLLDHARKALHRDC